MLETKKTPRFIPFDAYRDSRHVEMTISFGVPGVPDADADSIIKATVRRSLSPICARIPSAQLEVTLDNTSRIFDCTNPAGIVSKLQIGQKIAEKISIDGSSGYGGDFYITRIEPADNGSAIRIVANDKVIRWDEEEYVGTDRSVPLSSAVAEVIPGESVSIPQSVGSRLVGRDVLPGTTRREALRQMCQAARCTCWASRSGQIMFRDLREFSAERDILNADNLESLDCVTVKSLDSQTPVDKILYKSYTGSVYTAGNGIHAKSVTGAKVVIPSAELDVAKWMLSMYSPRVVCDCQGRGNPWPEAGSTIIVETRYGPEKFNIYEYELTYDGSLSSRLKGIGRLWTGA